MGSNCGVCNNSSNILEEPQGSGEVFPLSTYGFPQQIKFQIPCKVNHTLVNHELKVQPDQQMERGTHLPPYYIVPYDVYYSGQWKNGRPHGLGEITFRNGSIFRGTFINGIAKGHKCLFVMIDGSYYYGDIDKNKFQGEGLLKEPNGHSYTGQWHDNIPNGKGKQIFQNGDQYEGTYVCGKKQGPSCKYQWKHSEQYDQYVGGYKDDYFSGKGQLKKKNGTIIQGKFTDDDVQEALVKNQEYEYRGNVVGGKLNGNGIIKFLKTNTSYEGEFKNGQLHGNGTLNSPNQETKKGYFHKGKYLKQCKGLTQKQTEGYLKVIGEQLKHVDNFDDLIKRIKQELPERKVYLYEEDCSAPKIFVVRIDTALIAIQ